MKTESGKKKAEGRRQKAVRIACRSTPRHPFRLNLKAGFGCLLLTAFCLLLSGCGAEERHSVPPAAQATVDRVTEEIAAGQDALVYEEAAAEWRAAVTADENSRALGRVRDRLGRVESRALHTGIEQQSADPPLSGHTLELVYQTRFERASAMETFTLLERGGRWLLAGYKVSSDALK